MIVHGPLLHMDTGTSEGITFIEPVVERAAIILENGPKQVPNI